MAKWKLPEGRKPITTMESADLVLRMHKKLAAGFTAGNRIEELEAKLAKAEEILEREIRRVKQIQLDLPPPHKVGLLNVQREYELILKEMKGETDD